MRSDPDPRLPGNGADPSDRPTSPAHRPAALTALLVYAVLSVFYTWPLLRDIRSRLPSDPADPVFNTAVLWWNATTVPFSATWWNAPHYFPTQGVAAFTENLVGIYPFFTPIYWLTGNPIAAYNVAYFLTWPLSGFSVYLLVRFIAKRADVAFLSGLAFGFTPYRATEIAHIQSLTSYYLPLALLGLHGFLAERRSRWLWLFGVAWLLQSLANGYYMLFGGVLVGLWILYFCSTLRTWRPGVSILGAWMLASIPLVPIMYEYSVIHTRFGLIRTMNEVLAFSARPHSWSEVSGDIWFWRAWLPSGKDDLFPGLTALVLVAGAILAVILRRPTSRIPQPRWRLGLRLGLALVAALSVAALSIAIAIGPWSVSVAGVVVRMREITRALTIAATSGLALLVMSPGIRAAWSRRGSFAFYTAATVLIALLCCGPVLHLGSFALSPAPYRWLMALPGFAELRVPARFWMLGTLCLSVAAGLAVAHIRSSRGLGSALFAVVIAGILLDGWMPTLRMVATPAARLDVEPIGRTEPILELPLGPDWDWDATFRAVGHRRRVFNGISGYDPPYYNALTAGLDARDPAMLVALASLGSLDVVINKTADPEDALVRYVSSAPGAVHVSTAGGRELYRIPQGPAEPVLGAEWPIAGVQAFRHDEIFAGNDKTARETFDGALETGWGDYPQQPGQWLIIDLGQVREVGGLTHALGGYFLDFPRRLAIELSNDGTAWEPAWEGPTASHAFLALVRGPREGAMRFVFSAHPARFIRLLQLDSYQRMWRVSELHVHAPAPK